jgi:hypothetical protein
MEDISCGREQDEVSTILLKCLAYERTSYTQYYVGHRRIRTSRLPSLRAISANVGRQFLEYLLGVRTDGLQGIMHFRFVTVDSVVHTVCRAQGQAITTSHVEESPIDRIGSPLQAFLGDVVSLEQFSCAKRSAFAISPIVNQEDHIDRPV